MRLLIFIATLLGLVSPAKAEEMRRYRWFSRTPKARPGTDARSELRVTLPPAVMVPLAAERVERGAQRIGAAVVDGTWTQAVFGDGGRMVYAAGAVFDELPEDEWLGRLKRMQADAASLVPDARARFSDFRAAARVMPPELRLRKRASGALEAYWRLEYVNEGQDEVRFLQLGEERELLGEGLVSVPGADGRALVFPRGPRWSPVTEVPLRDLSGDGTLSSRFFRITSALGLDARSPSLLFFFPETDRRFDLAQVYFTMEKSLQWMRDFLGAELRAPLDIKLHIGENGVSNAAFYHANTIYLGTGDGITYKDLSRDPSVVTHESIHALIDSYAGLPSEGEGGSFNEGFADFYAALILQNPRMGDNSFLKGPFRRTLENDLKAYRDFTEGTYRNGSIIGGTLWDLRSVLKDEDLARLAFRTLVRLGPGARFDDFVPALLHAGEGHLTHEETRAVKEKLLARGWRVDQ